MKVSNLIFVLIITFSLSFAQWMGKAELPKRVGPGGGIAWGRGYVFAIIGDDRADFYAYFPEEDTWKLLPSLPAEIYQAGAIIYGKDTYNFERIFVAAQINGSGDRLFIYSFSNPTGPYGAWIGSIPLPEEVGPGVSLTFRPLGYISRQWVGGYEIIHGDLYLTIGNFTTRFYSLRLKEICPLPPVSVDKVFPPNDTIVEAQELFFNWIQDPTATSYQLQIDDCCDFVSPEIDVITEENFYIPNKIFNKGIYYWRVRSTNSLIWSETRKFTIDYDWVRKRDIPEYLHWGGSIAYHKYNEAESIYCLIGDGRKRFYCYSVNKDTWVTRETTDLRQKAGSSLVSCYNARNSVYHKELFAVFGGYTNKPHFKYRINRNKWFGKDTIYETIDAGASLTFDPINADLYLVVGGGSRKFYYNPYPRDEEDEENSIQSVDFIKIRSKNLLSDGKNIIISYYLNVPTYLEISVYNLYGKKIKTLVRDKMKKGENQISWDKKDQKGKNISSGVYFIVINNNEGKRKSIKVALK
ncbi:MAG: hypothetical protein ABIK40_02430 [candidate division WOR-3 bacterium]